MTETLSGVATRRFELTPVEFDVLWEWLGQRPTPVVLQVASPGRTHTERRAIREECWRGLRERGLVGSDGPDPELVRLLHLLARPAEQLELRAWWKQEVRLLGAATDGAGVIARRSGSTITVTAGGSIVCGLVSTFPTAERGPGRACTVPASALTDIPTEEARATLARRGVSAAEAGLLQRMLAGVHRHAQVVALAADRWGVLRRAGGVVGVLDTPAGRYLLTRRTGDDGVEWATVAPADPRQVRHAIGELREAAVRSVT